MSRINKEYRVRSYNTLSAVFSVYGQICGHRILWLFSEGRKFQYCSDRKGIKREVKSLIKEETPIRVCVPRHSVGGDWRARTADLLRVKQAL